MIRRRMRALGRREDGASLVEFAIVGPVLFLILFGFIELGRAVWYYNTASSLAREGARFGIVMSQYIEYGAGYWCEAGNAPGTYILGEGAYDPYSLVWRISRLAIGMEPADVQVTVQHTLDCSASQFYVRGYPLNVTVRYDFTPVLAGFLGIPSTITLSAESAMLLE